MARCTDSVCRQCRREGMKLFLKGDRCFTDKCAFERRATPPGQHGEKRTKQTAYAVQLREKQKVKRLYGILERQFRGTFERAERMKGITGENLLRLLELRLDNAVQRAGFARSRNEARQLVRHGHVNVNGKRVSIPSYSLREGDELAVAEPSRKRVTVVEALEGVERRGGVPDWLQLDKNAAAAKVVALPQRDHITLPIREQLIVELYSK